MPKSARQPLNRRRRVGLRLGDESAATPQVSLGITVVIPTLNEADEIADAVATVRGGAEQVIVVDGGSTDDTIALARGAGARVCVSPGANRATALNTGAALARSDVVYFVHADCRPPPGFADDIRAALGWGGRRLLSDAIRLRSLVAAIVGMAHTCGGEPVPFGTRESSYGMTSCDLRRIRRGTSRDGGSGYGAAPAARRLVRDAATTGHNVRPRVPPGGVYRMQLFVYPLVVALFHLGMPPRRLAPTYRRLLNGR